MSSRANEIKDSLIEIQNDIEPYLELLYSIVKRREPDMVDQIMDTLLLLFEFVYGRTLTALKDIYGVSFDMKVEDLAGLLFDKDFGKLRERIELAIDRAEDNTLKLFADICLIAKTETTSIYDNLSWRKMREVADRCQVVAEVDGGCDKCENGEFDVDNVPLPPYHPNCSCVVEYLVVDEHDEEITEEDIVDMVGAVN